MVRVGNVVDEVVMAPIVTSQSTCRCTLCRQGFAGTDLVRRIEARRGKARHGGRVRNRQISFRYT